MIDRRPPQDQLMEIRLQRMAALVYTLLMFRLGVRVIPGMAPAKVQL